MKKLLDSPAYLSSSAADAFDIGAAIVMTGIWSYSTVKAILGDNMGMTDLPSFTVDGVTYHLGSFSGCKLMGVKPQTDAKRSAVLHLLVQYLTNEKCQMERFYSFGYGPANIKAQQSTAVQNDPALAALLKQNEYAVPQGKIPGSWWEIAKNIASDVEAAKDEAGMKKALSTYSAKIAELVK